MFLDIPIQFINPDVNCKNKMNHQVILQKDKNIVDYTNSSIFVFQVEFSDSSSVTKQRTPAPKSLKRAMARASMKAISKALV